MVELASRNVRDSGGGCTCTAATGQEVTGEERERLWRELDERVFDYGQYQAKVDRRLAVVALTPVAG